jgi:hypothetical protein
MPCTEKIRCLVVVGVLLSCGFEASRVGVVFFRIYSPISYPLDLHIDHANLCDCLATVDRLPLMWRLTTTPASEVTRPRNDRGPALPKIPLCFRESRPLCRANVGKIGAKLKRPHKHCL